MMQCFLNFLAKRTTVRTKKKKICDQLTAHAHPPTAHTAMRDRASWGIHCDGASFLISLAYADVRHRAHACIAVRKEKKSWGRTKANS